jgi:hypothetical protein
MDRTDIAGRGLGVGWMVGVIVCDAIVGGGSGEAGVVRELQEVTDPRRRTRKTK